MAAQLKLEIDTEWLLRMAEKEGDGIFSVGGLIMRIKEQEAQEDAAAPAELPTVGVYGVPGDPDTWRRVDAIDVGLSLVDFSTFHPDMSIGASDWKSWVRDTGAVRIDGEGERVADARALCEELRERVATMQRTAEDSIRIAEEWKKFAKEQEVIANRAKERVAALEAAIAAATAKLDEHGACKNFKCHGFPSMTLADRIEDLQRQSWAKGSRDTVKATDAELETLTKERDDARTRVAALEAEVARLRADVSRMQTACDIFEKNSEGAAALWEGLHKIAKMPHSNPTGDTLHGPCPKCIAEDTIKAVGSEPQNLSRVTVLEKERDDARAECARLAAVEEKREARAAVSRLMEALRGIEGHDGDACDHEDYGGCWKWVQKMAREAIAKEEGGKS